jgi:hypothetical protein
VPGLFVAHIHSSERLALERRHGRLVRLTELDPRFVGAGGEGVYNTGADGQLVPAPERHGVGLTFLCPCPECTSRRTGESAQDFYLRGYVSFENPLDGGPPFESASERPKWHRVGETFETLQLSPSILSDRAKGGCGWHGYVGLHLPGEVTTV